MDRRAFVTGLGVVLAAPLAAEAQQAGKTYRVGVLCGTTCVGVGIDRFRQALSERGWAEGRNLALEYRATSGQYERLPALASELIQLKIDVLLASGAATVVPAATATTIIPVVFFGVGDPVKIGVVRSLARPGGNVTGVTYTASYDYWAKLLDMLKQTAPAMQRVGVLFDLVDEHPAWWPNLEQAGTALGVQTLPLVRVRGVDTFRDAVAKLKAQRAGGVIISSGSTTYAYRKELADLLLRAQLPSIGFTREQASDGGLLSYGVDLRAVYVRLAEYVDRILRGTKPADLPVEQPTKFDLLINLKTAKALGLTIPPSLLLRADQVLE